MIMNLRSRGVFIYPVAHAEYRSPSGSIQASPCSSRAAYYAADELASARSGEKRRTVSRAPGRILFGYFLLCAQEKVTCCGSATHKYAFESRAKRAIHSKPRFPLSRE